ncbi:MAG: hypothetical protein AAGN35_01875 [Bacteroidota bacterium]
MNAKPLFSLLLSLMLLLVACSGSNGSEAKPKDKDAHKITHITWREIFQQDTITLGDTLHLPFVFYNSGWKPVQLVECAPQNAFCACIVPTDTVPLGGQDTVFAHCVPPDTGNFVAFFTVTHTSPQQPEFYLSLKVQVEPRE